MLREGAALATVLLCVVCVLTQNPPPDKLCSKDVMERVKTLRRQTDLPRDSRLYTPNQTDFQICPISTMKCFAAEVEVLAQEREVEDRFKLGQLLRILVKALNKTLHNPPESDCRQCELHQEENPDTFLRELCTSLQIIQSQHCSSPKEGVI